MSVGMVIEFRGTQKVSDSVENVLTANKPENSIGSDCDYILENFDPYKIGVTYSQAYVHIVEPIRLVAKRDIE